jgi:cephalosporin hydroxylase
VTFLQGDCHAIETALPAERLAALPHPWLAIEDAHENVVGVVRHLDRFMEPGDYLLVEDSEMKTAELEALFADPDFAFRVDSRYTDFFGRNATCAPDSILKKV